VNPRPGNDGIRRDFVSIAEGQVHYRSWAPAQDTQTLLMIHASPSSSWNLCGLMRELGPQRRILAPDTLGNGDSPPPAPEVPDIPYYADANLRVLDALDVDRVDVYGSHTGAHTAIEMAIAAPDRVRSIVLDGIGMFDEETTAELLANYAPAIQPSPDGAQFGWAFQFVRDQNLFFPYYMQDRAHSRDAGLATPEWQHQVTVEVLKSIDTYHHAYRAAFAHNDRERLPLVTVPALVIADSSDPLIQGTREGADLMPDAHFMALEHDVAGNPDVTKAGVIEDFLSRMENRD
jgi:pimeloyl-ACP methyl ester carboxylesterase